MNQLQNLKENIEKCSRCGLCQSVCPIYKYFKNQAFVSKGKFSLIRGIFRGKIKFSLKFKKYFDICLNCNRCRNFCPSDINILEIFLYVKSLYRKKQKFIKLIDMLNIVKFSLTLNLLALFFYCYRLLKIGTIFNFLIRKNRTLLFIDHLAQIKVKRKIDVKESSKLTKIVFFQGCYNKYINPSSKNALYNILSDFGYKIEEKAFKCCAISFKNSGNVEYFEKNMKHNLSLIEEDCDYVIFDCATCLDVFKNYDKKHENRYVSFCDFLCKECIDLKLKDNIEGILVKFHKPCHSSIIEKEQVSLLLDKYMSKSQNEDLCCGFCGDFGIKEPALSKFIGEVNVNRNFSKDCDYVITTCPSCQIGLTRDMLRFMTKKNVVINITCFIDKYRN